MLEAYCADGWLPSKEYARGMRLLQLVLEECRPRYVTSKSTVLPTYHQLFASTLLKDTFTHNYFEVHETLFLCLCRSPLSPSAVVGSHALAPPISPATTGATLTTPTKKTHQRSKSDATAAITASNRLMQVSYTQLYNIKYNV